MRSEHDELTTFQRPGLRLALGLGDQELEQRLRPGLEMAEELTVVTQCLAADQLLQLVQAQHVDAVVVAWSLHRLTDSVLRQLDRPGLVLVLLVPDPRDLRWQDRQHPVLSIDADVTAVHQAILDARPGVRRTPRAARAPDPLPLKPADRTEAGSGGVIAVTGGAGSPGRTTLAINLATALGASAPTVLVEADLGAPAVAAYLNADPSRNLCTLAHTVRDDPHAWAAALADELQPLGPAGVQTLLLCGPPKREMRSSIGPAFVERLLQELTQRFRWIVVDVGFELLGAEVAAASHRAALARAQHIIVVSAADFVGLWHTRTSLEQLDRLLGIERSAVNLVLNRHDSRFHHTRQEVEWHLGLPTVAIVPYDQAGYQRAIAEQRPVVLDASSRAGRTLLHLAEGLSAGKLQLPDMAVNGGRNRSWWRRLTRRERTPVAVRSFVRTEPPAAVGGTRSGVW